MKRQLARLLLAAMLVTMPPWLIVNHIATGGGHTIIYKTEGQS